jgi:hypothetical protein
LTARRIRVNGFAAALDDAVAQHGAKRVNGALQDQFMPQLPANGSAAMKGNGASCQR